MNPLLKNLRIAVIAGIFLLGGFWAGRWFAAPEPQPEVELDLSPAPGTPAPPRQVDVVPEFSLPDLDGNPRSISEFTDEAVLINFWATWCAPCRREMPLLEATDRSDNGLNVLGIAVDKVEPARNFLAETGVTYPQLVGQQDAMDAADLFGIEFLALPFSILVAPGGDVLRYYTGEVHLADLEQATSVLAELQSGSLDLAGARERLSASPAAE